MSEPAYCNHYHSRNAGWRLDRTSGLWVAECGKPSKATWTAAQDKEIKMTETTTPVMCVKHSEFEADYCPACGNVPDLTAEPSADDLEAAGMDPGLRDSNAGDVEFRTTESGHTPAYDIYMLRTRLGLSRKQVQDGTGLGASVVWRAEQVGKEIDDVKRGMIIDFLMKVDAGDIKIEKTRKSRKAETPTGEALQATAEMAQRVMELHAVIDEALAELQTQVGEARKAKRSTTGLLLVIDILKDHGTTN